MKIAHFVSIGIGALAVAIAVEGPIARASLPVGPGDTIADGVLGQPDFTHNAPSLDGASLQNPTGVAIDSLGHLYVADQNNSRVLGWSSVSALTSGQSATLVIGQLNLFVGGCNNGGRNAATLCNPDGVAVDANNNLYVNDFANNRTLEYTAPFSSGLVAGQRASFVFGQAGNFTSGVCNFGSATPSAQSLCSPDGVAIDSTGNLYISDRGNARVLEFNTPLNPASGEPGAGDTIADMVFGQFGSFTSNIINNGGVSANSLSNVLDGMAVDAAGDVFVSDEGNNRVLEFTTPITTHSTTAHLVFGQSNNFTASACDGGGITANSLCTPTDLNLDASGNLYIADNGNGRVLEYNTPVASGITTAAAVLGQSSLIVGGCNNPSVSATSMCGPIGIAHDSSGNLYVADFNDNRVLEYATPIVTHEAATLVLGQSDFTHNAGNAADASSLSLPNGAVVDSSNHLYIADASNNRVLGYSSALSFANGAPANIVIGQPDFSSNQCNQAAPVSATTLCTPGRMAVSSTGNLYVSDTGNSRVVEYDAPFASAFVTNQPARLVFGQTSLTVNGCNSGGITKTNLCAPNGVALDTAGNLYVADTSNCRVLEFSAPLSLGESANKVFGQGGLFTTNTCNSGGISANSLSTPEGLATDSLNNLYVADNGNHRVLEFNTPLNAASGETGAGDTTADLVFGQAGVFTQNLCNSGGVSAASLCFPADEHLDASNNLYVVDANNQRILEYTTPLVSGTTASKVFGQGDNFHAALCNTNGGPSAANMCTPAAVAVDTNADLFVADSANNRALQYDAPLLVRTATTPTISPSPLAFKNVAQNNLQTRAITITANGTAATNFFVPTISGTNAADFTIASSTCVGAIAPAAKCTINVSFKPTMAIGTAETATLNINDSAATGSQAESLTGTSSTQTTLSPASLAFPTTTHGTTSAPLVVTLANNQQSSLTVSPSSITGTNAGDFSVSATTCGAALAAFKTCTYSVTFHPAAAIGAEAAKLVITETPDSLSPHNENLTGTSN